MANARSERFLSALLHMYIGVYWAWGVGQRSIWDDRRRYENQMIFMSRWLSSYTVATSYMEPPRSSISILVIYQAIYSLKKPTYSYSPATSLLATPKPARDAALCLRSLLLNCGIELVDLSHGLLVGLFTVGI